MSATNPPDPLRIANCSGFYGDRLSAAEEMVTGGPIDVLSGDWLAELTMLILAKDRMRDPSGGYARTFLKQMEQVLGTCVDKGIKIVSNAGGLNPQGCAAALGELASTLGLEISVGAVVGDDILDRLDAIEATGETFDNLDTGESLSELDVAPITANAYLGGWGIAEGLSEGADVVVTGRVTDAALVVGAGAWHFGWSRADWDEIAGAIIAGHIIECGTQCTGGNFAFFDEIERLERPGFPIAELQANGDCTITKHPGTGGAVTVDTVTAQLLYEIQSQKYLNPDASVWLNSIRLSQQGPDRVLVHGVRGTPGPERLKVCINYLGGYRNTMTFALTGLDIEQKASLVERSLWELIPGGKDSFGTAETRLIRSDRPNPATNDDAVAYLRITVMDDDADKVGRAFSNKAIELVLANYPGMYTTTPPSKGSTYGVYWPTTIPRETIEHRVVLGDRSIEIGPPPPPPAVTVHRDAKVPTETVTGDPGELRELLDDLGRQRLIAPSDGDPAWWDEVATTDAPLGRVFGARSGDKGGNANLGIWARTDEAYDWLAWYLSVERLRELMPAETDGLDVERYELANLRSLNFVIHGILGRGVAASTRTDAQAKGLGEYLRAKVVPIPTTLLGAAELARLERS